MDWIHWLTKKIFRFLCKIKMWLINARSCVPLWRRGFFGTFFVDYHSLTYLMMFVLKGFSDSLQKVLNLIFEKKSANSMVTWNRPRGYLLWQQLNVYMLLNVSTRFHRCHSFPLVAIFATKWQRCHQNFHSLPLPNLF